MVVGNMAAGGIGLGFSLRGEAIGDTLLGALTPPNTLVTLCSGFVTPAGDTERRRGLSDIVASAAI